MLKMGFMTTNHVDKNKHIARLKQIGLSSAGAEVYLRCLEFYKITPSKLAQITNIKRTTLYLILEKLIEERFIYQVVEGKKIYYRANPPVNIMKEVAEKAKNRARDVVAVSESLAKDLAIMFENDELVSRNGVVRLTGRAGVHDMVDRILKEKSDIYWLGPSRLFNSLGQEQQRELFQRLSVKRMDTNTTAFAISDQEFKESFYFHGGSSNFRQLRVIDFPETVSSLIMVTGDLCGFTKSLGDKAETLIFEDTSYAETIRFALRLIWYATGEAGE
jgi:sugar-specific transcriptional regulator TrmB